MKKSLLTFIAAVFAFCFAFNVNAKSEPKYPSGFTPKTTNGIAFTENKGQVHNQDNKPRPDVLFGAMAGNMAFHLKANGVSYQLCRIDKYKEVTNARTKEKRDVIDQQTIYRIDLNWLNANENFTKTTDQTLEGFNNYYTEGCPEGGALNVKSYSGVTLHNLYDGINLHYYEKNGQLKHDYIVAPHANYKLIQLKVEGASIKINKDGSLLLTTPLGKVQEGTPIVFQNGKPLKAKWMVDNNTLSFEIENYNANFELIIDPVTRLWGTYYGAAGYENGECTTTDATGNVYMSGEATLSTGTVIATAGAHQTVYGGGANEAFLVQFNSSGVRQWGTYYGGSGDEVGYSCAADVSGNVYLSGLTTSTGTVMTTTGAHQTVYGGGVYDAFLVQFNSSGVRQWGTYYGGTGMDAGLCSTDALGNVYLTGFTSTSTSSVITTPGAHQTVYGGGAVDAFLAQFNSSGVRQWGTYYGGSGDDASYFCANDAAGNVYFTGETNSNTALAINTTGAHQTGFGGGSNDVFLVKFNSSGVRQWGTYYGGSGVEYGYSCPIDAAGNVYLAGYTNTNTGTVIATAGAHQTVYGGGTNDAFLVKFNSSGVRQWGTYYGGLGDDQTYPCRLDATGNAYLAGFTSSNTGTVIATAGVHQPTFGGGVYDAFLAKFNSIGIREWGTYYGGTGNDYWYGCATDATGNAYLAGRTASGTSTVIATPGAHQTIYNTGDMDAFLVKFKVDCVSLSPNATTSATLCAGTTINLNISTTGTATPTYAWAGPNSFTAAVQNPSITNASTLQVGTYTVSITNGLCVQTATTAINSISPCTGINGINPLFAEVKIYPNPTNGLFTIDLPVNAKIEIVNAIGQSISNENKLFGKHIIDLSSYSNGLYLIKISTGQEKAVHRIVKQ